MSHAMSKIDQFISVLIVSGDMNEIRPLSCTFRIFNFNAKMSDIMMRAREIMVSGERIEKINNVAPIPANRR